ncbi:MAG: hypothetical protein ACR2LQ_02765 [Acidimicrobiales bacterium]
MRPRLDRVARLLLRPDDRQWLEAALAETPHVDPNERAEWRAGIAAFVVRRCARRFAVATAAATALVVVAFAIGFLDLNIEPTSVSLLLILAAGATGGYVLHRSWWLAGIIVGSSISLTAATVGQLDLQPAGRAAETSATSILLLLVLVAPASVASWAGATARRRRLHTERD